MLETLKNAFRIKDIRKKLFYTFCMILVIRLGSQLPVPGVDRNYFSQWFAQQSNDAFNFFSAFTGGSFEKMSIFALSITPYITSSIFLPCIFFAYCTGIFRCASFRIITRTIVTRITARMITAASAP